MQLARLEASHGLLTQSAEDWRRMWVDNPVLRRLGEAWPLGWVLETAGGRIVGSLLNVPSLYRFRGQELVAATGRAWVVEPEYRAIGLWLIDEFFNQDGVDLLLNTTVNGLAVNAFDSFGSIRVPAGDWESAAYFITGYRGFARAALRIKNAPAAGLLSPFAGAGLWAKDVAKAPRVGESPAGVVVESAPAFDARFDAFWEELARQNPEKLLAVRDSQTLTWHFAAPARTGQLWILTASRNGLVRAYAILKRQDHPPSGLVRMRLVDFQSLEPGEDLLPGLLRAALGRCRSEGIHTLEHVGCGLPKMKAFDTAAPYRRKLPAWPFYFKVADPKIDAALREPSVWDPSAYDGDTSL